MNNEKLLHLPLSHAMNLRLGLTSLIVKGALSIIRKWISRRHFGTAKILVYAASEVLGFQFSNDRNQ